jgi:uncharacterized protein (DUF2336 family)
MVLTNLQRATIHRLQESLFSQIEAELRTRLLRSADEIDGGEFAASLAAGHVEIVRPILSRAGLPRDPELAAVLLRRCDAYRIERQLRKTALVTENGVLDGLLEHDNETLSGAAMQMLIAEGRGDDRFETPHLSRTDLPPAVARRLVWTFAAALHDYAVRQHGLPAAQLDLVIEAAALDLLSEPESGTSTESAAIQLAALLDDVGLLNQNILVEALSGARLAIYVAMLAKLASLPFDTAWDMATEPHAASHAALLRHIGIDRTGASHLMVTMLEALGEDRGQSDERVAAWAEAYDRFAPDEIDVAMRPWLANAEYRAALSALGSDMSGGGQ